MKYLVVTSLIGILSVSVLEPSYALPKSIPPKETFLFQKTRCIETTSKVAAVTKVKGKKGYFLASSEIKRLKKLQKKKRSKQTARALKKLQDAEKICGLSELPTAQPQSAAVEVGGSILLTLQGTDPRSRPLTYSIVQPPSEGAITGSGQTLSYKAPLRAGPQSFLFTVSNGRKVSESAGVTITVIPRTAEEFSGDARTLSPYREAVTKAEVQHLCRKFAFGCTPALVEKGVKEGLSALVDALFALEPDTATQQFADSFTLNNEGRWTTPGAWRSWIVYMLKGNPLKERMAILWHDHFATNLTEYSNNSRQHTWIPDHLSLLRSQALGSFEDLFTSMHFNTAMLHWLDNRYNRYDSFKKKLLPNENYAREVLELFTMGVTDFHSGEAHYTEADMKELTRALTGFMTLPRETDWISAYDENRWDPGQKTLFAGKPFAATANFNYESATHFLLYQHPGTARTIAGKILRTFVLANPSEQVVSELADDLRKSKYDIGALLKKIMKASLTFSQESRHECITSPSEQIITLIRELQLPVTKSPTMEAVVNFMKNAGEELLSPKSVFGWRGCGVGDRGQDITVGEAWLPTYAMLNRQRNIAWLLNRIYDNEGSATLDTLLPTPNATARELLDSLVEKLGIPLSEDERQYLVNEYLLKKKAPSRSNVSITWNPAEITLMRAKIAGLIEILALHPYNQVR